MTGILTPLFEGKEVRLIEQTGELWIPLADIVSAWGIDRSTPDNMINRNAEVFAGLVTTVLDAASTPMTAINERGLYLMMGKITTGRVKNKSAREAIIRFQRWFPELIQKYRKGEIVQAAPDLRTELQEAKDLAALCDRPADSFLAVVFRKHGRKDLADALTQPVPPTPGPSQPGIWMIPQDIGNECGLSARQVNSWLYNHDFQYPDGTVWRLTQKGEAYGEEYVFTSPYKHSEIRIRWHRSILVASGLRRPMPESQVQLPARA